MPKISKERYEKSYNFLRYLGVENPNIEQILRLGVLSDETLVIPMIVSKSKTLGNGNLTNGQLAVKFNLTHAKIKRILKKHKSIFDLS